MKTFISSVRLSVTNRNFYAALFMTLTLPDICKKLENPADNNSFTRYKIWFEKYMSNYNGFLSGDDCYALRCALLHEGSADITSQKKRKTLEYVLFMEDGAHMQLLEDCVLTDGRKQTFLQLNVQKFCEDICLGVEAWQKDVSENADVMARMKEEVKIHKQGFLHHGIRFS